MTTLEFHILKLKMTDGRTIDVPVVMLKATDGKVMKKMSYKQYRKARNLLPPLRPSSNLQYLLEQKKKVIMAWWAIEDIFQYTGSSQIANEKGDGGVNR